MVYCLPWSHGLLTTATPQSTVEPWFIVYMYSHYVNSSVRYITLRLIAVDNVLWCRGLLSTMEPWFIDYRDTTEYCGAMVYCLHVQSLCKQ